MQTRHPQREIEEGLLVRAHLLQRSRRRGQRDVEHLRRLHLQRGGVRTLRIAVIEDLADAGHAVDDLERPVAQRHVAAVAPQAQTGPTPLPRHLRVVAVELRLLRGLDGSAAPQHAVGRESLEEPQLVLVHANRVEGPHVERPHLHVLDAAATQRLGRAFARKRDALRPDEAVVLVLDLQQVRVQLPVLAVHLDPELLVLRAGRRDRVRQVADVMVQRIHGDLEPGLALVAVTEIAHSQRRRVGGVNTGRSKFLQPVHLPALQERRADRR